MKLSNREWRAFRLVGDSIFNIEKNKSLRTTQLKEGKDIYDLVGATNKNNGNVIFIGEEYKDYLLEGNCICLIKTGQGSVGKAVYKSNKFIQSNNVTIIRSEILNRYIGNFLVTVIDNQSNRYSYGYIRNDKRIEKEAVMLPVDTDNNPDWSFMEQYIKKLECIKYEQYKQYAKKRMLELEYKDIEELSNKEWGVFNMNEIFIKMQRGKRLTRANQEHGNIPYVSSTAMNNGVDNFIQYKNNNSIRKFKKCLSLANSGSVGACFYEPFEFIASDHITHLKNDNFNEYIYLFIASIMNRLSEKYNFNREINDLRLSREKILLPINSKNEPDYEYIEQYIKNIMHKKYNQYLNYISKK